MCKQFFTKQSLTNRQDFNWSISYLKLLRVKLSLGMGNNAGTTSGFYESDNDHMNDSQSADIDGSDQTIPSFEMRL